MIIIDHYGNWVSMKVKMISTYMLTWSLHFKWMNEIKNRFFFFRWTYIFYAMNGHSKALGCYGKLISISGTRTNILRFLYAPLYTAQLPVQRLLFVYPYCQILFTADFVWWWKQCSLSFELFFSFSSVLE